MPMSTITTMCRFAGGWCVAQAQNFQRGSASSAYRGFRCTAITPLLRAVFNDKSDAIICEKVYDLLIESTLTTEARLSTPPPSGPSRTASFQQTSWTFNIGNFAGTSDLRKNADPILRNEVEDNL